MMMTLRCWLTIRFASRLLASTAVRPGNHPRDAAIPRQPAADPGDPGARSAPPDRTEGVADLRQPHPPGDRDQHRESHQAATDQAGPGPEAGRPEAVPGDEQHAVGRAATEGGGD